jgi:transcriptional regulator with XRE-family HTH domain
MLRQAIQRVGTSRAFAREVGIGESALSRILSGREPPSGKILRALGLRRRVVYERIEEAAE